MEIIICDDNKYTTGYLEDYFITYFLENPESLLKDFDMYVTNNPYDVLEHTKEHDIPRLCIFDIVLKTNIDGIELAERIFDKYRNNTYVVFITANDLMNEVFEKSTKPFAYVSKTNLERDLNKALVKAERVLKNIYYNIANRVDIGIYKLRIDDIVYIETVKGTNYTNIFCYSGKYKVRLTISEALEILGDKFFKCDKSLVINTDKVEIICDKTILLDKASFKCSKKTAQELKTFIK